MIVRILECVNFRMVSRMMWLLRPLSHADYCGHPPQFFLHKMSRDDDLNKEEVIGRAGYTWLIPHGPSPSTIMSMFCFCCVV